MKRTVETIVTKEYVIEIADDTFTPEFVKDFESAFWELDGDSLEEKYTSLFDVAAYQLAAGERTFIEGIGECQTKNWNDICKIEYPDNAKDVKVIYDEVYDDTEVTVRNA